MGDKRPKQIKKHNKQGSHIKIDDDGLAKLPNYNYPIFCLRNLHNRFSINSCDDNEKKELAILLVMLSNLSWNQIQHNSKYKCGSEKIPISSLTTKPTKFITPDINELTVIRRQNKMLIIGHRNQYLFHVIYIDPKLKAYSH